MHTCGAIHWSIEGFEVGEDGMKNCINRGSNDEAYLSHCSDGYEKLSYQIIPPPSAVIQNVDASYFPNPNINEYIHLDLTQRCRGTKVFRYSQDGTVEVEGVHSLPSPFFYEEYHVQYMYPY